MSKSSISKNARALGLLYIRTRGGKYALCKELENYNFSLNPLGLKIVFSHSKLKVIKAFLADLKKKKERKEMQIIVKDGVAKRAECLKLLKQAKRLKVANNEPSLFDFVS